jgi:hypothetical protein
MARRPLQRKLWWLCIALALLLYVCTYLSFTRQGRYTPIAYGAEGPKLGRRWAPKYFERNGVVNFNLIYFYAPLYVADVKFWHQNDYDY